MMETPPKERKIQIETRYPARCRYECPDMDIPEGETVWYFTEVGDVAHKECVANRE